MEFYKGTEVKFAINLKAQGFSMDDNDFDVEVKSPGGSVKGYKGSQAVGSPDVVIFKESVTPEGGGEQTSQWCVILDTKNLSIGNLRVIATAHIPDTNANDGVRSEIAVTNLGKLVNP